MRAKAEHGEGRRRAARVVTASGTRSGRRAVWVRAQLAKVPTRWIVGAAAGLVLAVSAAFGGLAEAVGTPVPELEAGEAVDTGGVSISVDRAQLADEVAGALAVPGAGQRLLAVTVTVENLWDQPMNLSSGSFTNAVRQAIELELDGDLDYAEFARVDGSGGYVVLQPGVPEQLDIVWTLDDGALRDGDTLGVEVFTTTVARGVGVIPIHYWVWSQGEPAARVEVTVADAGETT